MKYPYIEKWSQFLNIGYEDCYTYNYNLIQIKFKTKDFILNDRKTLGSFGSKDYILITDTKNKREIIQFDHHFIFKIYYQFFNTTSNYPREGKYTEKLIVTILMKILSEYPKFIDRYHQKLKEINDFNICENKEFINLINPEIKNFPVNKFKVYKFYFQSEKCKSRVGRDNKFFISEISEWYIKFEDTIIRNEYLQSLLPPKENNDWEMHAYSSTAIGETKRKFTYRKDITEEFKSKFEIEKFIESINNSGIKTKANIG